MKRFIAMAAAAAAAWGAQTASAQYYQMASQLPGLISPALSGSLNYKGFVELTGLAGLGDTHANDISLTTSQGFRYSSWFFMGAGVGIDVMMGNRGELIYDNDLPDGYRYRDNRAKTRAMIPVFSDFRFNIGPASATSFYLDVKLGAAWVVGGELWMEGGYVGTDAQFFLRPSAGVRIPASAGDTRRAFNIGVTYQLLTSDNNTYYGINRPATLNNLGVSISYEW